MKIVSINNCTALRQSFRCSIHNSLYIPLRAKRSECLIVEEMQLTITNVGRTYNPKALYFPTYFPISTMRPMSNTII